MSQPPPDQTWQGAPPDVGTRPAYPAPGSGLTPQSRADLLSAQQPAWIAAIAALLAGVLTVVGTVWGAYQNSEASQKAAEKAASAAVKAVEVQLSGETEKSRSEFLRAQRQTLYSGALEAVDGLDHTEINYYAFLSTSDDDTFDFDRDRELERKLDKAFDTFNPFFFKVELLGSEEVAAKFRTVYELHSRIRSWLSSYATYQAGARPAPPEGSFESLAGDLAGAESDLVQACRVDVGSR
jgi:hypothetical protein